MCLTLYEKHYLRKCEILYHRKEEQQPNESNGSNFDNDEAVQEEDDTVEFTEEIIQEEPHKQSE